MKMAKYLIFLFLLFANAAATASRVDEIENYYVDRVSEFLRTRFPSKPFTVFAKVDTGEESATRQSGKGKGRSQKRSERSSLPYLDIEDQEYDFWSRTDLPIGTLISELKSVFIKIQIDESLDEAALNEFKEQLAKQLKLAPTTDRIEVVRMSWDNVDYKERRILWGAFFILPLLLFGIFALISRISIKNLVKGLAQPIAEIGKQNEALANNALNMSQDLSTGSQASVGPESENSVEEDISLQGNLHEIRMSAIDLLQRNIDLLRNPDSEVLDFLERTGERDPGQVGSVLAELSNEDLKGIFRYGRGDWWFAAVARPATISGKTIRILNELDRLRLRRQFCQVDVAEDGHNIIEAGLILSRLEVDELSSIFSILQLEDAEPFLSLLPRSKMLAVAKTLFPGQWGALIEEKKTTYSWDPGLMKLLLDSALAQQPLRSDKEISAFFSDLDTVEYLDSANPRDEHEFYLALPKKSRILRDRVPFYSVFETSDEVKKRLGPEVSVKEWALAFVDVDRGDVHRFLSVFSDRQSFLIKEELRKRGGIKPDAEKVSAARRKIVRAFMDVPAVELSSDQMGIEGSEGETNDSNRAA